MAWHMAAFQRTDKLPPLDKLLARTSTLKPKPQTVAEQRTMLEALSQMIGVPLRKVTPRGR